MSGLCQARAGRLVGCSVPFFSPSMAAWLGAGPPVVHLWAVNVDGARGSRNKYVDSKERKLSILRVPDQGPKNECITSAF